MSARKKTPALLITTCAHARVGDDGEVEVIKTHTEVDPVILEYVDDGVGEVVYDTPSADGRSSVGWTRTYAASWESVFGGKTAEDELPN